MIKGKFTKSHSIPKIINWYLNLQTQLYTTYEV